MNMKKISAVLVCAGLTAAFAQQPAEPVYVNGPIARFFACEFAENGAKDPMMKDYEQYITNNRFYFLSIGSPVKNGKLAQGTEFLLSPNHTIRGEYRGNQTNFVDSDIGFWVAGYAEKGKVVITHVFSDWDAAETWSKTVKLAFNYQ